MCKELIIITYQGHDQKGRNHVSQALSKKPNIVHGRFPLSSLFCFNPNLVSLFSNVQQLLQIGHSITRNALLAINYANPIHSSNYSLITYSLAPSGLIDLSLLTNPIGFIVFRRLF